MTGVSDEAAADTEPDAHADTAVDPNTAIYTVVIEDAARPVPASWPSRAGAFAVDVLLGVGVVAVFMLVAWSARVYSWAWWLCILLAALVAFAIAANRLVLPVITGWSLGRSLYGIAVVRHDGRPIDPWFLLLRDIAHLLDTIPFFLGWFWPLVDSRRRTFADIVTRTEVCPPAVERPDFRRPLTVAVASLGVLALLGAGLGYLAVYRYEQADQQARQQIAEQGPKIVPEVLSYAAGTLDADFERARSLVTDSYRPKLVEQQEAIRKAGSVVGNEYWVTNSAVVSATPDHAEMLLLMQGQRGAEKAQRFITATLLAAFDKSGTGQWQVANLTVLAKPVAPQQPQQAPASDKPAPPASGKPAPPASGSPAPSPSNPPKQGR